MEKSSKNNTAISNRLKVVSSDDLPNLHETKIVRETVLNAAQGDDVVMKVESSSSLLSASVSEDENITNDNKLTRDARIYEYGSAANPDMKPIPVLVHPASLHESGTTRVMPFDISKALDIPDGSACTSPNLMASFIRINVGDDIATHAPNATSQAFYVIRGSGKTSFREEDGKDNTVISWSTGDMFCVPLQRTELVHACTSAQSNEYGAAALYWIHDEPLMNYLGVAPIVKKFEPTLYTRRDMLARVQEIQHSTGNCHTHNHNNTGSKNRLGVLLGNAKCAQTKTMTHVLWSLLNSIPADTVQRPHRHNSVALDLCVSASSSGNGGVYTLMGKEIDAEGFIVDPIRCDWHPGTVFITPPGWWHSHHNESEEVAWVLPVQDAGLYTHQRTLDIRFVDDELKLHSAGRIRGSAFNITNKAYTEMVKIGAQVPDENFPTSVSEGMDCDDEDNHHRDGKGESSGAMATTSAGPKRIFSAQCSVSFKRLKCTQVGADVQVLRKLNNRLTSLEGHVESIFD